MQSWIFILLPTCHSCGMVCLLLFIWSIPQVAEAELTYYVATNGNDQWSGTLPDPQPNRTDGPFATLEKARDTIRAAKANTDNKPIQILIRGGRYAFRSGLVLTAMDSGTKESPVIYRRFPDEVPIFLGGKEISGWKPWKDKILQTDVVAQGFRGKAISMLVLNGECQHLARYPNFDAENPYGGGWAYADGKLVQMYQSVPGETRREFQVKEQDHRRWSHPERVEVFVFPRYNWWNNIVRVDTFDSVSRKVTLAQDCSYSVRPGDRYFFQNALEELDAPGEWFLDQDAGKLYFWPPAKLTDQTIVAPTTQTILSMNETAHVRFQGIVFECAEGTAIKLKATEDCQIAGCEIRNAGNYSGSGISVSGGHHNSVFGCNIHQIGSNGISLTGGNRTTLEAAENVAENNHIHHVGRLYKQGVGIAMNGVGNRAAHNLIHDTPRMGIMFGGNNLIIEYNHIHHVNMETEDTGAIYTGGRDWISSRGSVIRYNYVHDSVGYGKDERGNWSSPRFAWGIYLDDNTGGVDVIGNIIARCSRGGLHLHNARDNHIENNIFLENGQQQAGYAIGYSGWTENSRMWTTHLPTMIKGYETVARSPAWAGMRNMQLHPSEAVLSDGTIMSGNLFTRNIIVWKNSDASLFRLKNVNFKHNQFDNNLYWHFDQPIDTHIQSVSPSLTKKRGPNPGETSSKNESQLAGWNAWKELGNDEHSLISDPLFEEGIGDQFKLKTGSPAELLGFKPIPVEKIGPYADPLQASRPIKESGFGAAPSLNGP